MESTTSFYPVGFEPDHTEKLKGKGEVFSVPGTNLIFRPWLGKKMVNDWRKVPVEYEGRAVFAELAITLMLIKAGWSARWVEVFYLENNMPYYLLDWNDAKPFKQTTVPLDVPEHVKLMESIDNCCKTRGRESLKKRKPYSGAWDVLAWKGNRILFIESKHKGEDFVNGNQVKWFLGAIDAGLSRDNFLVAQWRFEDLNRKRI